MSSKRKSPPMPPESEDAPQYVEFIAFAVLAVYAIVAPAVGPTLWLTFVVGQAYVLARVFAKLVFYASQTAYFQSQLAHAEYVAAPRPVWPDSPAAEAISGTTT